MNKIFLSKVLKLVKSGLSALEKKKCYRFHCMSIQNKYL